jgi:hypothetical protein
MIHPPRQRPADGWSYQQTRSPVRSGRSSAAPDDRTRPRWCRSSAPRPYQARPTQARRRSRPPDPRRAPGTPPKPETPTRPSPPPRPPIQTPSIPSKRLTSPPRQSSGHSHLRPRRPTSAAAAKSERSNTSRPTSACPRSRPTAAGVCTIASIVPLPVPARLHRRRGDRASPVRLAPLADDRDCSRAARGRRRSLACICPTAALPGSSPASRSRLLKEQHPAGTEGGLVLLLTSESQPDRFPDCRWSGMRATVEAPVPRIGVEVSAALLVEADVPDATRAASSRGELRLALPPLASVSALLLSPVPAARPRPGLVAPRAQNE